MILKIKNEKWFIGNQHIIILPYQLRFLNQYHSRVLQKGSQCIMVHNMTDFVNKEVYEFILMFGE